MRGTVRWNGVMGFEGQSESGHRFLMDLPKEHGGEDKGMRPMEALLLATGGCSSVDVVMILKKGRHAVSGCEVQLEADRAPADPKVFTRLHFHFVVRGKGLKPEVVERAIALSHEKYCSASAMLGKTAAISHDFEIVEE